jgi:hypothetical protein
MKMHPSTEYMGFGGRKSLSGSPPWKDLRRRRSVHENC